MIDNDAIRTATEQLAAAIRQSDEYKQYKALKDTINENETTRTLLKQYMSVQTKLQMAAVSGRDADSEDVERFNKLSGLLYMQNEVAQYLMAQMRMQQVTGEVIQRVANAAELELPGM